MLHRSWINCSKLVTPGGENISGVDVRRLCPVWRSHSNWGQMQAVVMKEAEWANPPAVRILAADWSTGGNARLWLVGWLCSVLRICHDSRKKFSWSRPGKWKVNLWCSETRFMRIICCVLLALEQIALLENYQKQWRNLCRYKNI